MSCVLDRVCCGGYTVLLYCVYSSRCMNSLTIARSNRLKAWGSKEDGLAKAVNLNWCGTNPTLSLFRGVILHLVRSRVL